MSVLHINDLVRKYENLKIAGEEIEETFIALLKEDHNIKLEKERVSYRQGAIYVDASALIRTRVMQVKPQIIKALEKRLTRGSLEDIR